MLILTRREGERLIIEVPPSETTQRIEIELNRIKGNQARIGIDAAKCVKVLRTELLEEEERIPDVA